MWKRGGDEEKEEEAAGASELRSRPSCRQAQVGDPAGLAGPAQWRRRWRWHRLGLSLLLPGSWGGGIGGGGGGGSGRLHQRMTTQNRVS